MIRDKLKLLLKGITKNLSLAFLLIVVLGTLGFLIIRTSLLIPEYTICKPACELAEYKNTIATYRWPEVSLKHPIYISSIYSSFKGGTGLYDYSNATCKEKQFIDPYPHGGAYTDTICTNVITVPYPLWIDKGIYSCGCFN